MDRESLRSLMPELRAFFSRYEPHFGRSENHAHAQTILQGLLAGGDRRNVENMAELMDGAPVRTLQKFIAEGGWNAADVLQELQQHVVDVLGDEEATLIIDETGFPKKGTKSVGVSRQYAGIMGKVDNCQVGVFASYCSTAGHTLIDRRLFLPEVWTEDRSRCDEAGVPERVVFRSKPALAAEMVEAAVRARIPFRWVAADSLYGTSPLFVQTLRDLKKWYVLDVNSEARAWTTEPTTSSTGRKKKPDTAPSRMEELAAQIPANRWKRLTVAEGSQGPRIYEFAEMTVWFSEDGQPAPVGERLLFKRSLSQDPELKYQRSNAPQSVPLKKLAEVGGCRWSVEQDFECGKGECGLDEYETRGWIGWHHHTALSMISLWYLMLQRVRLEKKTPLAHGPGDPAGAAQTPAAAKMDRGRNPLLDQPQPKPKRDRRPLPRRAKQATTKTGTTSPN